MNQNFKLPTELEAKRDELSCKNAFALDDKMCPIEQANSPFTISVWAYTEGFNAGVTELGKYLASLGDEFDLVAAEKQAADFFHNQADEHISDLKYYYRAGARWQHEQSKLKFERKKEYLNYLYKDK